MSVLLLSAEERKRFSDWLEQDAESNKLMLNQLAKLGPHTEPLVKKMKTEIIASLIVCQNLRNVEEVSIGNPKGGDS